MTRSRRVAAVLATAMLGVAGSGATAQAQSMSHWSSAQCNAYKKGYLKKHPHASKSQKSKANTILKNHGCSAKIK
jgi:hypothetical protein